MPSTGLLLLGGVAALLVLALVAGSVYMVMRDSFRELNDARERQRKEQATRPQPPRPRVDVRRYTPERTRLRWFSPEVLAVLLLSLAAGLWLARLVT